MSLCRIHLKKLVCQAANQGLPSFGRHPGFFSQWFKVLSPQPWNPAACVQTGVLVAGIRLHCTADQGQRGQPIVKKKENPNAKKVIGNVGRLIPYSSIQVISENGEDMGKMSRRKAIQTMEERGLKLVMFRENADPPIYKLMTGKQLFEEQTKLREKQKLSSGHSYVQTKDMSFLASIEKNDLDIKKKQLVQWIEKKNIMCELLSSNVVLKMVQEKRMFCRMYWNSCSIRLSALHNLKKGKTAGPWFVSYVLCPQKSYKS
ncbi:unnamed protein product [Staurois parvus]|uniref:Translation initiation factor 3 N-terminal domain-containing protein n=1 Tax=Staurois parvus TaxID=386267 RepID=A0ABN9AU18_9NEOB|nr:unnamed protein product [Staurois parvus]